MSLIFSYALNTWANDGVNIIILNSSYKINGRSVKAKWPISLSTERSEVLFDFEEVYNEEVKSQFFGIFPWNISEVIVQCGCLTTIYLFSISSLIGVNHGSKLMTFLILSSLAANEIAVVEPSPWPAIVRLFMSNWISSPS